jgi:serine phosphatase RsbU (regulator of sigma subunit)
MLRCCGNWPLLVVDRAVRRYIYRILAVHLAFLLLAVVVVTYAGRNLYVAAKAQGQAEAVNQARPPANQAADAIRRRMSGLLDTLSIASLDQDEATLRQDVWPKIRTAASDLIVLDRTGRRVLTQIGGEETESGGYASNLPDLETSRDADVERVLAEVVQAVREAEDGEVLAGPMRIASDAEPLMFMAVEADGRIGIAVSPLSYFDEAFLNLSREPGRLALALASARVGVYVPGGSQQREVPPRLAEHVRARLLGQSRPSQLIEGQATFDGRTFDGMLPIVVPVRGIASPTSSQELVPSRQNSELAVIGVLNGASVIGPIAEVTRTAVLWAAAVIAIMTAILVSSSVQLIRGRSRLERMRAEVVESELKAARQIQLNWLPDDGVRHVADREVDVAADNLPASHISGDFYNYFELPGVDGRGTRLALVIGDVTGHGMAAAFLMSTAQLLAEAALRRDPDPGTALTRVNAQLARQAHGGQFVTLLLAVLDADENELCLASAGHAGPLLHRDGRWQEAQVDGDLVAGVMEQVEYETTRVSLDDVGAMLFYTDGAVEAQNLAGDRFNLALFCERLNEELPTGPPDAQTIIRRGLSIVRDFTGGAEFDDDVTLLGVYLEPVDGARVLPDDAEVATPSYG